MKIKLTNEAHISYARTDDACAAFKKAVTNGQARLALEMMVDIVDYIDSISSDSVEETVVAEPDLIRHEEEKAPAPAKKTAAKKTAAKKTESETKDEVDEETSSEDS